MSALPFQEQQLEFMIHFARHRPEWLNPFFCFLNYFDSPYFYFSLIAVVWIGISYRWGIRLFYWITFNHLLINFAKNSIGWLRPSTQMPEIALFHPHSYGFPSGGAELCMFLGGLFIYFHRTKLAAFLGALYILLISFSRLYLGVHYPIDILGGWLLAWIVLALFILFQKPLEEWLIQKGSSFCFLLSLLIPLALTFLFPTPSIYYMMGGALGIGIGIYFSLEYRLFLPSAKKIQDQIGRSLVAIGILFAFAFLTSFCQILIQPFAMGLLMSVAASPLCKWLLHLRSS